MTGHVIRISVPARWDPTKAGLDGNESWSGYSYRKMVVLYLYRLVETYSYGCLCAVSYTHLTLPTICSV